MIGEELVVQRDLPLNRVVEAGGGVLIIYLVLVPLIQIEQFELA